MMSTLMPKITVTNMCVACEVSGLGQPHLWVPRVLFSYPTGVPSPGGALKSDQGEAEFIMGFLRAQARLAAASLQSLVLVIPSGSPSVLFLLERSGQ